MREKYFDAEKEGFKVFKVCPDVFPRVYFFLGYISYYQKDYVDGFGLWYAEKGKKLSSVKPDEDLNFEKTWEDGRIAPVNRIHTWWAESINSGFPVIPGLSEGLISQKVCEKLLDSAHPSMGIKL